jgi:hypothetical protein
VPSPEHDLLSSLGVKWLKRQGFPIVATEINAAGSREQADVVGFRSTCSAIIEVKVSRADFLADKNKPERRNDGTGLGVYRFYLCQTGLIQSGELPPKWGLLYADGGKVAEVVKPKGNIWPGVDCVVGGWSEFQHAPNLKTERSVLFSITRRLAAGKSILKHQRT